MAEYINSNDDAGNLALYGGLGLAAFAGGAALAYRATSPIYKNGKKGVNDIASEVAEGVVVPERGRPADFSRGALLGSTKGLFSKNSREQALGEMSEAVRDSAMTDAFISKMAQNPKAQAQLSHLGGLMDDYDASYKQSLRGIGDDVRAVAEIMQDGNKDVGSAYQSFKKNNPNTLAEVDDVERYLYNQNNGYATQQRGVKKSQAVGMGQSPDVPHEMLNNSEVANVMARRERLANMRDHERGAFDYAKTNQQGLRQTREAEFAQRQQDRASQALREQKEKANQVLRDNAAKARANAQPVPEAPGLSDRLSAYKKSKRSMEGSIKGPIQDMTDSEILRGFEAPTNPRTKKAYGEQSKTYQKAAQQYVANIRGPETDRVVQRAAHRNSVGKPKSRFGAMSALMRG